MAYLLQRLGLRFSRGWALAVLLMAATIGAAFWIGPLQPAPALLDIVALDGGRFADSVTLRAADAADGEPLYPLVLGVRNTGPRAARPTTLSLSVPNTWRIVDRQGNPLPAEQEIGVPLARYTFKLPFEPIEAGAEPMLLPGIDTIWLAPRLDRIICTLGPDDVPEFVAGSAPDAESMSSPVLYYSFGGRDLEARQTGLLPLQVDPADLRRAPPPRIPSFPAIFREPEAPHPETGELVQVGDRTANCGEPDRPVEVQSVVWRTAPGGTMIVVYYAGAPRRQLFDLDADGMIETEMWDPDADGRFEALRPARLPIPAFLLPPATAPDAVASLDTLPTDSVWRALLDDTTLGPLRFTRLDSLRRVADSVRAAEAARRAAEAGPRILGVPVPARDTSGANPAPDVSSREDTNEGPA